jgi:hypothetical protein
MQLFFFPERDSWRRLGASAEDLQKVLDRVAAGTDTTELVVALHLVRRSSWSGGTAYVRQWVRPAAFYARRGKWRLGEEWTLPKQLPARFKLIRLLLPDAGSAYPLTEVDRYGWRHRFGRFQDHLAFFFAHELHHFRRYHLGLHPREGEHGANAWAVALCGDLGYSVESERLTPRRKKRKGRSRPSFWQVLNPLDFWPAAQAFRLWRGSALLEMAARLACRDQEKYIAAQMRHVQQLRKTPPGTPLWISFDPERRYAGQPVRLVRPLRPPSLRAIIETADGKVWRWPMAWLTLRTPAR